MKRSLNFALALLVIAALALGMFAVAEAPAEPEPIEGIEILDTDVETDETDMDEVGLALGDLVSEGPEAPATVAYRFIVGEADYQVQQVREGEAVLRPEDPAAPEGMTFAAWVLADGAPLFVDADGDGETDPVIAHVDAQGEVKVWASFAQGEEQPTEEQPTEEAPADEEQSAEEPQKPSPATEGSDSGEGGAIAPEEVVPQTEPMTADETEGETTSSDSPDGEPASPEGEALSAPEEQHAEEEPSEASQEPSPLGEGGAAAPEEVVPQAEPTIDEEGEGETTSSDSPGGEPASPEGEALSAPEEQPVEEQPAEEATTDGAPVANALTYTGEAQPLVTAGEGWLFSMDGEAFAADIPAAVDAGEYTVFFKAAEDAEAQALTVTVAKADVVLIPPEAMTGEA